MFSALKLQRQRPQTWESPCTVLKSAKKYFHLMRFPEFFQANSKRFAKFPFPVIARIWYLKFVKSLQKKVWPVTFTNLKNLKLGGFLLFRPNLSWTTRRTATRALPPSLTKTSFATTSSKTSRPDAMAPCLSAASEAILALRRYCTASLASVYSGNMPN